MTKNSNRTWTPERLKKFKETLRLKRESQTKKPPHSVGLSVNQVLDHQVATLRDVVDALESDLRTLREILGQ